MALLPQDEQPGAGDEGLEAYSPSVKRPRKKAPTPAEADAAAAEAAPSGKPSKSGELFAGLRVSLMPSDLEGSAAPDLPRRLMVLALVVVVETVIIGAAYFFVARASDARMAKRDALQAQIDGLDKDVAKEESLAKEAAAYNGQVSAAKEALDKHVFWSRFFATLEAKTHPTVKYLNFSGDSDSGIVTLDALGKSYRDVAEQIVAFKEDPLIIDVRTASAAAKINDNGEVTGVSFTMVLRFKPATWQLATGDRKAAMSGSTTSAVTAPASDCGTYKGNASPYFSLDKPEQLDADSVKAANCIADKFKACTPATAVSVYTTAAATVTRAVEIRGASAGGCQVKVRYGNDKAPSMDGKDMLCVFNPQWTVPSNMFSAENEGIDQLKCAGPLADAFKANRTQ